MRHFVGLVLTGLGVFLLVSGVLIRFYAAPRLVMAPTDIYQITTLRAENATYFDAASLKVRTGVTITATSTVRGDVKAGHGDIAVWDSLTMVQDLDNGRTVDIRPQRVAFDRRTAELTACCGASAPAGGDVRQPGIGLFWPVDVARRSYQLFDAQTGRTWPIRYDGEESVRGVRTYRFVQHIPATRVTGKALSVPGDLLGRRAKSGSVAVDRYYQADVTYWIDPRTGAPLNSRQKVLSTLQAQKGPGRLVVADMDLQMTDASQRGLLAKSEEGADGIRAVRTLGPLACLVTGLVSAAAGLGFARRRRRAPRHTAELVTGIRS
ncbi:DUF3068 domain-containing protein [Actinomadura scrupuli]|uniref:DUF3068 domain-containing protein n=1 Tax=Actinomadura scrupuli TaxID=559629 RepID=UPI003D988F34